MSKLSKCVLHQLFETQHQCCAEEDVRLLSIRSSQTWHHSIFSGDEKWVLCANIHNKRSWCPPRERSKTTAKPEFDPKKVMLSVWCESKRVWLFELLPTSTKTSAQLYCQQLDRLAGQIQGKRPNHGLIRFLLENTRPHITTITCENLFKLDWEALIQPSYSPDLLRSKYHLIISLSNALQYKAFSNDDEENQRLEGFLPASPKHFIVMAIKICQKNGRK